MLRTTQYILVITLLVLLAGVLLTGALRSSSPSKWAAAGNMAGARSDACAVVLSDGCILVAGGSNNAAEIYAPAANTWVIIPI